MKGVEYVDIVKAGGVCGDIIGGSSWSGMAVRKSSKMIDSIATLPHCVLSIVGIAPAIVLVIFSFSVFNGRGIIATGSVSTSSYAASSSIESQLKTRDHNHCLPLEKHHGPNRRS